MIVPPEIIDKALDKAIEVLIAKYDELGMRASGKWARELEPISQTNRGVIRGMAYTEQLVQGRAPGNRPPISPLEDWVKAKFGLSGKQATSTAFAVANKIAKEGTTWYPDGSDLLEVLESPEVTQAFYDIIGDYLRVQITEELTRTLRTAAA